MNKPTEDTPDHCGIAIEPAPEPAQPPVVTTDADEDPGPGTSGGGIPGAPPPKK